MPREEGEWMEHSPIAGFGDLDLHGAVGVESGGLCEGLILFCS